MHTFKHYLTVGIKGACMGAADVIPGVSGGTIAFITGLYDELVGSIASINAEAFRLLLHGQFKAFWRHINGNFLLSLVLGIGVSVVALAGLMQMLLTTYPIQTWAFFFGLIVASSIFILRGISGWRLREFIFIALGVALGVTVCTLSPTQTPDSLWFIFLSGAIAICAMILPGISGSFILLILGKYQFIMGVISDLVSGVNFGQNLLILSTFGVGAIVGILSFSKFLHWLLARWQKPTMLVLAGFIIGSLVKVWPWSNKDAIVCSQFAGASTLEETIATFEGSGLGIDAAQKVFEETVARYVDHIDPMIGSAILFALIGFFLVTGIEIAGKVIAKRKAA